MIAARAAWPRPVQKEAVEPSKDPTAGYLYNMQRDRNADMAMTQQFVVYCQKYDGRRVLFSRYATRQEADEIAGALRRVGCRAFADRAPA
jgi:hypothetical protein